MSFQLFAMTGLFRNQQVAGSTPAGGSRTPLKRKNFPSLPYPIPPTFNSNCAETVPKPFTRPLLCQNSFCRSPSG